VAIAGLFVLPELPPAEALAEARRQGALDERARIGAILSLDDAMRTPKLAYRLSFESDATVAEAKAVLASVPRPRGEPA
jgi:hypothetical protein